jgi:polar amino acid transport system substrate-binding protein
MSVSQHMRAVAGVAAALLLYAATAFAADADLQKVLAPTGKLRAALYPGTPTSIVDPKESEPRGVGYELGKELARRLGVPYEPVVYAKNADVQEAMKAGNADVAFTNRTAARQKEMDFGPAYLLIELGFLVPADSPITSSDLAAIDQKGRRIGVAAGSTSESTLSRELKNAEVVRAATNQDGAAMVAAGKIDAFATNKATLFELAAKTPGVKMPSDRWGEERHGIAIPKGREQGVPYITAFTADVLAQGLVKAAMDRAGLKGAKTVE